MLLGVRFRDEREGLLRLSILYSHNSQGTVYGMPLAPPHNARSLHDLKSHPHARAVCSAEPRRAMRMGARFSERLLVPWTVMGRREESRY